MRHGFPFVPSWRLLGLAVLALAVLAPSPARAQGRQRVEEEIRRTDEVLERAAERVRDGGSARAQEMLQRAFTIQSDAKGQFGGGRYLQAGRLTLEARALGARAATLGRDDDSLRLRSERELERAARELARVRDDAGDAGPGAAALLDEAADLLDRGRSAFGEQQYQAALRLAVASQRLAAQAQVLAGNGGPRRLERELERTELLLDRLEPPVRAAGDPAADAAFDQARGMQASARAAAGDGHPREALAKTREARELANRARALVGGGDDPARVESGLADTDRAIERTASVVDPSGVTAARTLLERARDHQSRARAAFDAHDLRRALAQTRVARSLAARALQMVDGT